MSIVTPGGEAGSFSPLKLLQSAQDELLFTAFDAGEYNGLSFAVYYGTTGTYPTLPIFAKGCILIQATDATILINTNADLTVPSFHLLGTSVPAALANGDIFIGNVGNVPAAHALSGDVTITNTGVATISAGAVTGAKMSALPSGDLLVGSAGNVAIAVTVSKDLTMIASGAATVVGIQGNTIVAGPYTAGDLFYFDGTFWNHLPVGTNGQVLTVVTGLPAWV